MFSRQSKRYKNNLKLFLFVVFIRWTLINLSPTHDIICTSKQSIDSDAINFNSY